MLSISKFFNKKRVLITGHTGFKGSWLTLCLKDLGADILGVSNNIPTKPSHFKVSKINKEIKSKKVDVANLKKIKKIIYKFKPDFIFHLAAQSLVKESYKSPIETWRTNLIGTLNILESLKKYKKKVTVVLITSDKSYKNIEQKKGYKENDVLSGIDPYSASKSSADIAIQSYFNSYFKKKRNITIGVGRAGNVVGGGDWSKDRLIPDCMRAWSKGKKVIIRNPNSTRPGQHVLEAVWGYIILAINLKSNKKINGEPFNFGPNTKKNHKVIECVKIIKKIWPDIKWRIEKRKNKKFKEASLLKLNSEKAKKYLKWQTILNFDETMQMTALWYKNYYKKNSKVISYNQIKYYKRVFKKRLKIKI